MKEVYITDFDSTLVYNSLLHSSLRIARDNPTKIPRLLRSITEVISTLIMEDNYKKMDTIRSAYERIFNNSKKKTKEKAISRVKFKPGAKKLINSILGKMERGEAEKFHIATFAPEALVIGKLKELADESERRLDEILNKIEINSTVKCKKVKNNLADKYSKKGYQVSMIGDSAITDGGQWNEKPSNVNSYCVERGHGVGERITRLVAGEMNADKTKNLRGILKETT